ncbi:MAG: hypothetical protein ABH817_01590 [archaeon]
MKNIVDWNIKESKKRIRKELKKDKLIIFYSRILEDIQKNKGSEARIVELFHLIHPYERVDIKKMFQKPEGLILSPGELKDLRIILKNPKNVKPILERLVKKYLPNSSQLIEPVLLSRLISAMGSVKKLTILPSSTIQLIGAEKALFRHKKENKPTPKYGLLYYSKNVKDGKSARQLANKLAISIKVDYYKHLAQ